MGSGPPVAIWPGMRNRIFISLSSILALVVFATSASAQQPETPDNEVFVGYSFLSVDRGFRRGEVHGFALNYTRNINDWAGLEVDGSGHYEGGDAGHHIMAGPRFTLRNKSRVEPFAHVLAGAAITNSSGNFAAAFGGGLDVRATDNLKIRLVQADYTPIITSDTVVHNARISTGVVFTF